MISLLGPPPQKLLDRADGEIYSSFYTTQGMHANAGVLMPLTVPGEFRYSRLVPSEPITFANHTPSLHGEDKRLFIEFASKMLRWVPEERLSAKELYSDPWLTFRPEIDQKVSR